MNAVLRRGLEIGSAHAKCESAGYRAKGILVGNIVSKKNSLLRRHTDTRGKMLERISLVPAVLGTQLPNAFAGNEAETRVSGNSQVHQFVDYRSTLFGCQPPMDGGSDALVFDNYSFQRRGRLDEKCDGSLQGSTRFVSMRAM